MSAIKRHMEDLCTRWAKAYIEECEEYYNEFNGEEIHSDLIETEEFAFENLCASGADTLFDLMLPVLSDTCLDMIPVKLPQTLETAAMLYHWLSDKYKAEMELPETVEEFLQEFQVEA